jgi:transcription initiation factor TFIIE subunit alpha
MRLNQKRIEEVSITILGEEGLPLIRELYGKENVSEFDLANRTKKDIKVIRKQLYLLYNNNVVGFTRKKDKQKGWYIYYWTLLPESIMFLYIKRRKEALVELRAKLETENKEIFFSCKNNCARMNFDQAMDFEFHCPECGELVSQVGSEGPEQIKKRIAEIEEELANAEKSEPKPKKNKPAKESKKKSPVKKVKKTITKKAVKKTLKIRAKKKKK